MSEARLIAGVEVSAWLAAARRAGGFGTVLRKGDDQRGAILLVILERGLPRVILERMLQLQGDYHWETRPFADPETLEKRLESARRNDPDLWILELDVPSAERFIAETTTDR